MERMPRIGMRSGMLLLTLLLMVAAGVNSCSTIVAGPKATKDGSTFASHSNDGGGSTDGRLVSVPARDYPAGTLRPIYYATEDYPRYVGPDLGPSYMSTWPGGATGYNDSVPIGHIPQVAVSHCDDLSFSVWHCRSQVPGALPCVTAFANERPMLLRSTRTRTLLPRTV